MAQLIIHELDDALLVQLKRRAWEKGVPLQEYLHQLLESGVQDHWPIALPNWLTQTPWMVRDQTSDRPRRPREPTSCSAVAG